MIDSEIKDAFDSVRAGLFNLEDILKRLLLRYQLLDERLEALEGEGEK